jgi:hypothetical protein
MNFIVKVRVRDPEGNLLAEWPEQKVKADKKWDALIKVVESFNVGLEKKYPMTNLWRWASIRQETRKAISEWRTLS